MNYNSSSSSDPKTIVDWFADSFQSIYDSSNLSVGNNYKADSLLPITDTCQMYVNKFEVVTALRELEPSTCADCHGIFPIVLKNCSLSLSSPLKFLFNQSLSNGEFLDDWKISFVSPVYKSGSKKNVLNYRPITKLAIIPKILDKIVKTQFYSVIKNHISNCQHGFYCGRSTTTNLACFSKKCFDTLEKHCQMDVVYTDFVKAFSRVNHLVLIKKLKAYGFDGTLLKWFTSYLSNRRQIVKIGDFESFPIIVRSGVPEGSHLGPPLFGLFINDFPSMLCMSECLMFADDIKLFKTINNLSDCIDFQNNLNIFDSWCFENDLLVNLSKCCVLTFSRKANTVIYGYSLKGEKLSRVNEAKDLGVIFDTKMTFESHITHIVSKANSMLGFLKRNSLDFKDPYTLKALFCSIVRPLIEYNCIIWNPISKKLSDRLEAVQKNFLRYALKKFQLNGNVNLNYKSRCLLLGMHTLESRRKMYSVMFIRDCLCSDIVCEDLLSYINIYAPSRQLRIRQFIFEIPHSTNYGQREPISHCCKIFNLYYDDLDTFLPRDHFKTLVLNFLQTPL